MRDIPTHDQIERMEERLDGVISKQKNLFLIIFQVIHDVVASLGVWVEWFC